jgi:hypothetical protein
VIGVELRPWQELALARALEHDATGELVWRVVVLTVSRQSGKSALGRVACGWRQDAGCDLFGEPQLVLNTANKFATALELWMQAAYVLQSRPGNRVRWARGNEELANRATGSRWMVQAATPNLGVGLSVSMALVDEAWNVERDCVESALVPTMLERRSPQLWIVSTAGDSGSDLLETYRQEGIRGLADPTSSDVLLLEWSAPPDAAIDDRAAWRAASPHWHERRERFIAGQMEILPDAVFRTQFLNQAVDAIGGWITRPQWSACRSPIELDAGPTAGRLVAACELSQDGRLHALVVAQQVGERVVVRAFGAASIDELWNRVCELPRSALLLISVGYKGRVPLAPCESRLVGVNELRLATRTTLTSIQDGVIAHDGHAELASHVCSAVVAYTGETGPILSQRRSPAPITYARALCWAVGALLEPEQRGRPMVASRS